ncbi:MAG TPA: hypothetical protein VLC95_04120, partial [Anaerolineae bacterium]|nr:hypothetical protein [Anaerolineae bacterium]
MAGERTRVGLHARNDVHLPERDYELVRRSKIETIKMMSFTDPAVFERLRRESPGIEFIVRLYDERFGADSRPAPADFVNKMVPYISRLQPYATKFEIHNEPNHVARIEGWGASDDNAHSFRGWYMQVLPMLRQAAPWASFGFPGLALNHPHRDLEWLTICQDAIRASDWLGCHCYWQFGNMLNDQWGLRFKLYRDRFPNKRIEITEFGNSTPNLPASDMSSQYARYYAELFKYSYLGSASAFIASSPDPTWAPFVWLKEGGELMPVAFAVGDMARPPLTAVPVEPVTTTPVTPVTTTPVTPVTATPVVPVTATPTTPVTTTPTTPVTPTPPRPTQRLFPETGKTVRGAFLEFFDNYGLDICGYPITEQIEEAGFPAQYFQRVAMEQLKSGKIRLKLVGTEAWTSRARIAELKASVAALEARIKELSAQPPAAGGAKPTTVDLVDALLKHATKSWPTRSQADIRRIVIHHTATSPTITPLSLAEYQVRTLDKAGITYHFFVAS